MLFKQFSFSFNFSPINILYLIFNQLDLGGEFIIRRPFFLLKLHILFNPIWVSCKLCVGVALFFLNQPLLQRLFYLILSVMPSPLTGVHSHNSAFVSNRLFPCPALNLSLFIYFILSLPISKIPHFF